MYGGKPVPYIRDHTPLPSPGNIRASHEATNCRLLGNIGVAQEAACVADAGSKAHGQELKAAKIKNKTPLYQRLAAMLHGKRRAQSAAAPRAGVNVDPHAGCGEAAGQAQRCPAPPPSAALDPVAQRIRLEALEARRRACEDLRPRGGFNPAARVPPPSPRDHGSSSGSGSSARTPTPRLGRSNWVNFAETRKAPSRRRGGGVGEYNPAQCPGGAEYNPALWEEAGDYHAVYDLNVFDWDLPRGAPVPFSGDPRQQLVQAFGTKRIATPKEREIMKTCDLAHPCPKCGLLVVKEEDYKSKYMFQPDLQEAAACLGCKHEFCRKCSADRRVIKAHGNNFHAKTCRFYKACNAPVKFLPRQCPKCKESGQPCKPRNQHEI